MSIKIGGVDVPSQIVESEFRILVLEQVVDLLLKRIPIVGPVTCRPTSRAGQKVVNFNHVRSSGWHW